MMETIIDALNLPAGTPGLSAGHGAMALPVATQLSALLNGARARGVADALNLLGIAAVLVDADGAVLHVNAEAAAFMGSTLGICAGQLVASTYAGNAALQRAIDQVLRCGGTQSVGISADTGGAATLVHVLGAPEAADDATQLLKAVIVFEPRAGRCGEATLAAGILRQSARLN